ncbi:putative short chain alcohol dehydrogenase [Ixodes scapularis]
MSARYTTIFILLLASGTAVNSYRAPRETKCRSLGLEGRLAVVTGGASGIGRSACLVLAREGATVVVADRNRTGSDETLQMLQASYKGDHRAINVDVSDSTAVDVLFEKIKSSFPGRKITCVVNSAGVVEKPTLLAEMSDTVFDNTISTNLRDRATRDFWEKNLQRSDKRLEETNAACELHFEPRFILRDYAHIIGGKEVRIPCGLPDGVPSLLPSVPLYLSCDPPAGREERKHNSATLKW